VVLTAVEVPVEHRLRLAELGLRPGDSVRVLGRTVGGGRIVGIGSTRLAIDRSVAEQLLVTRQPRLTPATQGDPVAGR
jgi:Fe2+ transport system protein FeoA